MYNNNLEYEPDKELTMKKLSRGVPIFSKMSEKSIFSPTFSEFTKIEPKVPQTKKNIVPMDKSLGRDMKMYRRTEAYDNIMFDNDKLDYIKNICFTEMNSS